MRSVLMTLVRWYQRFVSPHLPRSCIYHPSCSVYMQQALLRHGVGKGLIMGILRVIRCNGVFFVGGADPVMRVFSWRRLWSRYAFFWRWRRK